MASTIDTRQIVGTGCVNRAISWARIDVAGIECWLFERYFGSFGGVENVHCKVVAHLLDLEVLWAQIFDDLLVGLNLLSDRGSEAVEHPFEGELLHDVEALSPWRITCANSVAGVRDETRVLLSCVQESVTSVWELNFFSPFDLVPARPRRLSANGERRCACVFVVDSNAVLFNRARSITGNRQSVDGGLCDWPRAPAVGTRVPRRATAHALNRPHRFRAPAKNYLHMKLCLDGPLFCEIH